MGQPQKYPRDVWFYGYEFTDGTPVLVMLQSDEQHANDKADKFKMYVTEPFCCESRDKALEELKWRLKVLRHPSAMKEPKHE